MLGLTVKSYLIPLILLSFLLGCGQVELDRVEIDEPDKVLSYFERGINKYNLEDYAIAIQYLTKAIEIDSGFAKVYFKRGLAEYKLGDKQSALEDLGKARELGYSLAQEWIEKIQNQK